MGPGGEFTAHMQIHQDSKPKTEGAQAWLRMNGNEKQPGEVSYCDSSYPLGVENPKTVNVCNTGGSEIIREEDCKHAASMLGYPVGTNFQIKDDWINPSTGTSDGVRFAKNCVLINGTVYMNPTDSAMSAAGWEGTPICSRDIYKNGTSATTADAGCEPADDYEPVDTYAECEWAHDCQFGGMFCQEPDFGNELYSTTTAPKGCYRNDATGCYGFNANTDGTVSSTGSTVSMSVVCKLKTYVYTAGNVNIINTTHSDYTGF
jgi:hypothetical protein